MRLHKLVLQGFILWGMLAAPTYAALSSAKVDPAIIRQTQSYLNTLKTIKAQFTQIAPDGSLANGTFYMQRPGKMRWQYNPPVPVLIISRGSYLRYIDYELEQVSDIPLDGTLASMLASKIVDFSDPSLQVLRAEENDGVITLHVTQRATPDEGELTFEFESQPLRLRNIMLKDAKGEETTISLSGAEYNTRLDKTLFQMDDPRLQWRKDRR